MLLVGKMLMDVHVVPLSWVCRASLPAPVNIASVLEAAVSE